LKTFKHAENTGGGKRQENMAKYAKISRHSTDKNTGQERKK
jgi:hypothetical protein